MLPMRRTNEHKAETRQHIVDAAGRLFRQHGIDAVGVDAIMHAAGLTHGGFYGHFPSKEALVAEVAAASLARSAARWDRIAGEDPPGAALQRIVGPYLDPAHVAEVEGGCVLTTLGPEVARRPEARPGIAASVRVMADALGRCLPGADRAQALAALSTMVGAVVLARLADSPDLAKAILAAAEQSVTSPTTAGEVEAIKPR
jgi:TetR/AcrR family transcriptional regulator, transcriptional repressor for nem operon